MLGFPPWPWAGAELKGNLRFRVTVDPPHQPRQVPGKARQWGFSRDLRGEGGNVCGGWAVKRDSGGQPCDWGQIEMVWSVGHFPEAQGADQGHTLTTASVQVTAFLGPVHSCFCLYLLDQHPMALVSAQGGNKGDKQMIRPWQGLQWQHFCPMALSPSSNTHHSWILCSAV